MLAGMLKGGDVDLRINVIDQTLLTDEQLMDAMEYGVSPQVDPDFVCVCGERLLR